MKKPDFSQYYPLFFTVIFIIVLVQYSFYPLETFFYDLRLKTDLGVNFSDNVVIVSMDGESDQFLGETYPYTYNTHNRFLTKLLKDKPRILNYFVNLQEPELSGEIASQEEFKTKLMKFTDQGGSFRFGTDMDAWGEIIPPMSLRELGFSLSLVNEDSLDGVSRKAILNTKGENSLHLWTANRYREYKGESKLEPNEFNGSFFLKEADATFARIRFYTSPLKSNGRITRIPYHRVVVGNFPKGFFADKIVLVGSEYLSNSEDYVRTPFSEDEYNSPKLFFHAAIIQSLIKNKTVYALPRIVTDILAIALAILLSFIISKTRPTTGLLITIGMMLGTLVLSGLSFYFGGLWIYTTHIVLSIFVVYYIWIPFRAIAEYQSRYKIQEEAKLLKRVDNLKQNFISLMSHDLKTPVAKVAGIADILIHQHENSPEQRKHLNSILNATTDLNQFISSILDLTKIESSNLKLNLVSKDINPIIESTVASLRFQASSKNISVETNLSPLYPIQLDLILIKRVLSNLVENAIKYAGKDSVVTITTTDDDKWVTIDISDNGVGIPPVDLENIFDKFYRVKNDASHKIKGSGLGLYLVKYFVELHGGEISVDSKVGEGTTFTIKLLNK